MTDTTALSAFLALTHYVVISDFGSLGIGGATDVTLSFDDAVDAYAEQMGHGMAAAVFECNAVAGTYRNVTAQAVERLLQRPGANPDWLEQAA